MGIFHRHRSQHRGLNLPQGLQKVILANVQIRRHRSPQGRHLSPQGQVSRLLAQGFQIRPHHAQGLIGDRHQIHRRPQGHRRRVNLQNV